MRESLRKPRLKKLRRDGKILASSQPNQPRNSIKRLITPGNETYTSFNQKKSFLRQSAHPDIQQSTIKSPALTGEQKPKYKIFKQCIQSHNSPKGFQKKMISQKHAYCTSDKCFVSMLNHMIEHQSVTTPSIRSSTS